MSETAAVAVVVGVIGAALSTWLLLEGAITLGPAIAFTLVGTGLGAALGMGAELGAL